MEPEKVTAKVALYPVRCRCTHMYEHTQVHKPNKWRVQIRNCVLMGRISYFPRLNFAMLFPPTGITKISSRSLLNWCWSPLEQSKESLSEHKTMYVQFSFIVYEVFKNGDHVNGLHLFNVFLHINWNTIIHFINGDFQVVSRLLCS